MNEIPKKVKQWIEQGRDPRSAHWQAGLESILNVVAPYLVPGKLTPVAALDADETAVFREAQQVVDLSPDIHAAFLPPSIAGKIIPPESAAELERIDPEKPSYKLLLARPGEDIRIACAEVSDQAKKPGVDIFQSGALLGTYDFEDRQEYMAALNRIVRAHIWEKDNWKPGDYKRYTVNWFERVVDANTAGVCVAEDFSFFHTPTLIKSNRIDAIFTLIFEFFLRRADHPDEAFEEKLASIRKMADAETRKAQFKALAEKTVLQLLTLMDELELVDFESFSEKERRQFSHESERAVQKLVNRMGSD
ncbi:MAG: hypothetical protein ACQERN_09480 [Thermodesulfobacteriota bacterium]